MAVYEFALDSTGTKRVQVFESNRSNVTVLINGSIIADMLTKGELQIGRSFILEDASVVNVQALTNTQFQVTRDEQPLRPMSEAAIAEAEAKATAERDAQASAQASAQAAAARANRTRNFNLKESLGWIIVGIGAFFILVAFFSLPYAHLPHASAVTPNLLSSPTASDIASAPGRLAAPPSGPTGSQSTNYVLWLLPILAVIMLVIAGVQIHKSSTGDYDAALGVAGMIGLALLALIVAFIIDNSVTLLGMNFASLPRGLGYWITITGILLSIAGSIVAAVVDF